MNNGPAWSVGTEKTFLTLKKKIHIFRKLERVNCELLCTLHFDILTFCVMCQIFFILLPYMFGVILLLLLLF